MELDAERGVAQRARARAALAAARSADAFGGGDDDKVDGGSAFWSDWRRLYKSRWYDDGGGGGGGGGKQRRVWCGSLGRGQLLLGGVGVGRHKVEAFVLDTRCGRRMLGGRSPPVGFDVVDRAGRAAAWQRRGGGGGSEEGGGGGSSEERVCRRVCNGGHCVQQCEEPGSQ